MGRDIQLVQISRKPRFSYIEFEVVAATTTSVLVKFKRPVTNVLIISDADNVRVALGGHASNESLRLDANQAFTFEDMPVDTVGIATSTGTANVQVIGQG